MLLTPDDLGEGVKEPGAGVRCVPLDGIDDILGLLLASEPGDDGISSSLLNAKLPAIRELCFYQIPKVENIPHDFITLLIVQSLLINYLSVCLIMFFTRNRNDHLGIFHY